MVSLSEMLQEAADYCRKMFKDARLDNLDALSTSFCRTPLHIAVMSGDIKFAKKILSKPEGLELALKKDSNGFTPLHLASARTSLPMVRLLLKAKPGACKIQDGDGKTPLHLAAMKNRVEIMKLLMEEGESEAIHLKNDKETILHLCVKSNSTKDNDDNTVLQLATEMKRIEVIKYLLECSNIKIEANEAKEALDELSPAERNDLKIGFTDQHFRHGKKHKNKTVSKQREKDWRKERMNALMVVATLIAGITYQATLNPPGGFWQDDSKVDSGTDPITFNYYLHHMFDSAISGSLDSYIKDHLKHTSDGDRYHGVSGTQNNVKEFLEALVRSPYLFRTREGLILDDFNFTTVVSDYKNRNGSGGFIPYLIRHAGYPILAYTNPNVYAIYMNSNVVAFLLSLNIIFLVLSGTVDKNQLRALGTMTGISTLCIGISYMSILYTITPVFYARNPIITSFYVLSGVYGFYRIIVFVLVVLSRKDSLKNKHLTGFKYLAAFVSVKPIAVGKLILFVGNYCIIFYALFSNFEA